jgi:hypothetical protein
MQRAKRSATGPVGGSKPHASIQERHGSIVSRRPRLTSGLVLKSNMSEDAASPRSTRGVEWTSACLRIAHLHRIYTPGKQSNGMPSGIQAPQTKGRSSDARARLQSRVETAGSVRERQHGACLSPLALDALFRTLVWSAGANASSIDTFARSASPCANLSSM